MRSKSSRVESTTTAPSTSTVGSRTTSNAVWVMGQNSFESTVYTYMIGIGTSTICDSARRSRQQPA